MPFASRMRRAGSRFAAIAMQRAQTFLADQTAERSKIAHWNASAGSSRTDPEAGGRARSALGILASTGALLAQLSLLASCGGGDSTPRVLSVEIRSHGASVGGIRFVADSLLDPCGGSEFRDNGSILYVLVPRGCVPAEGKVARLRWGTDRGSNVFELPFTAFAADTEIEFQAGYRRVVSAHQRGSWRSFPNTDSWQHRDGAGLLVLNGELYLLGGWTWGPVTSEIWKTRDLLHWEFLGNAPWPARHGAAWVVHRQRLYVIGGDFLRDTWSSNNGVDWIQHSATAPFGTLYTPNAASIGGKIVLYAGQGGTEGVNNVWESADGVVWRELRMGAPWAGRGLVHGSAVHDGRIYLVGGGVKAVPPGQVYGETKREFSDIWSSLDGVDWRLESETLGFPPRTHFSLVATPVGCFVSDGSVGTQANVTNDLFVASDCVHFAPVPDTPPLEPRHASSLAYFNGSLVILGGPPAGGAGTKVWQYFP
jgi:hypothetical protein